MKENKRFYLIYKITNNLNQKFYIGKHETNNLDDDYFGSGKHLINTQNKYGLENFTKTILFYCQNLEEMNLLEHYVVTPEFYAREDVYNIMEGGNGGWNYCNSTGKRVLIQNQTSIDISLRQQKCGKSMKDKIENMTKIEYFQYCQKISSGMKKHKAEHPEWMVGKNNPMYEHQYTQETLYKMHTSHLGEKKSYVIENMDLQ